MKIVLLGSCKFSPYHFLAIPTKLDPQLYESDHEAAYVQASKLFYPAIDLADEIWVYAPEGIGEHTKQDMIYAESKGKKIRIIGGT